MARRRDTGDQTLRLLPGPGENDSFHLKNGTDCVGANAKKKKKTPNKKCLRDYQKMVKKLTFSNFQGKTVTLTLISSNVTSF